VSAIEPVLYGLIGGAAVLAFDRLVTWASRRKSKTDDEVDEMLRSMGFRRSEYEVQDELPDEGFEFLPREHERWPLAVTLAKHHFAGGFVAVPGEEPTFTFRHGEEVFRVEPPVEYHGSDGDNAWLDWDRSTVWVRG